MALLARMASSLCHHDWHVTETTCPDPLVAVGRQHVHLFNAAPQPVRSADNAVSLWMSGEFCHTRDVRRSIGPNGLRPLPVGDAALALAVYEAQGAAGLSRLEGTFLVAVWDGRIRELVIVNDRFGLYPHVYARAGGGLTFAPELSALLCNPGIPRNVDFTTVAQFARFQQALGDRTWLDGVHLLPPAACLHYQPAADRLTVETYWDWNEIGTQQSISFEEAVDAAIGFLQRAVDARVEPPFRAGLFLSGGLDGRTILGLTADDVPLATITYGAEGCRDVVYAARLARAAGRPHHWFPFTDGNWVKAYSPLHLVLTSGLHGWMHAHGISVLEEVRRRFDVNLSGFDGGTIFGAGIDTHDDAWYRQSPTQADLVQRFYEGFCRRFTYPGLTDPEAQALFGGRGNRALLPLAIESLRAELAGTTAVPPGRQADYIYNRHHLRWMRGQLVIQRSAIEVRCPFFDYAFVDFMYSLPERIRTSGAFRRAVLTRRMPLLARIPNEKDNRLPHSSPWRYHSHAFAQKIKNRINRHLAPVFADRPRLYADYENYLRTDLREWAEAILFDPRTQARGVFDPAVVRELWRRHLAGTELWTIGKVGPLISIELALRCFVDGDLDFGRAVAASASGAGASSAATRERAWPAES